MGVSDWAVSSTVVLLWVNINRFLMIGKYFVHACGSYFDRDGCWRHRSVLGNVGPLHRCCSGCSSHVLEHKQNTHLLKILHKNSNPSPIINTFKISNTDITFPWKSHSVQLSQKLLGMGACCPQSILWRALKEYVCTLNRAEQKRADQRRVYEVDRAGGGGRDVLLFHQDFTDRQMHQATAEKKKKNKKIS